jgi:hypothetical protein
MYLFKKQTWLTAALLLTLTACGGGGGATPAVTPPAVAPATAATPALSLDTKTFRFTWTDVSDATHYKLQENTDGTSGFVQVGSDIAQNIQSVDHIVSLYARLNASYMLQSCNTVGCTDSSSISITGALVDAIGFFKASNTGPNDSFGGSVSLSSDGNTLAVGATGDDSNTIGINTTPNDTGAADNSGAVYVFSRSGTTWSEQAYIKASNTGASDFFGNVSLNSDGNTLVVGAKREDSNTSGINTTPNDTGAADDSGAVYVFSRSGTTWSEQTYIKASNTGNRDFFGDSVSLSSDGNTLAVGATGEDATAGAVYVFIRSGTTWSEQAIVKSNNIESGDRLGTSVSLSADGNTLAASANFEDSSTSGINTTPDEGATLSGAVYVFIRSGVAWSQQAYVKASNPGDLDLFGIEVSLSADGNTLAVAAAQEGSNTSGINTIPNDDGAANNSGAVYVFSRSDTIWIEQAYVKASNTGAADGFFLVSLSADGKTLAVGAGFEDSNTSGINTTPNDDGAANNSGAVYLY